MPLAKPVTTYVPFSNVMVKSLIDEPIVIIFTANNNQPVEDSPLPDSCNTSIRMQCKTDAIPDIEKMAFKYETCSNTFTNHNSAISVTTTPDDGSPVTSIRVEIPTDLISNRGTFELVADRADPVPTLLLARGVIYCEL